MNATERDFPGRNKTIGMLGIPLGFGAGEQGSDLGVTAVRMASFRGASLFQHIEELGYRVNDHGDVEIVKPRKIVAENENPKYLEEIIQSSENSAAAVKKILEAGEFPLLLGGDHSTAAGTFSGISSFFHDRQTEIGLIWFDAHADMNVPETSPSGNMHGMPLAALLGIGNERFVNLAGFAPKIKPAHCVHVGARDLDAGEKEIIRELGMRGNFFTMSDIDRRGMPACVAEALEIASQAAGGFAVTFDVDVIDPRFAPGSGTLVRGGITYREAHLALEICAENSAMRSFEIVEVNPLLDERNITVQLAGELILSALGKTIL